MTAQQTLDLLHTKIHALRMMPKYSPSRFEWELNQIIAEEYKDNCSECKERAQQMKYVPYKEKSFLGGLFK